MKPYVETNGQMITVAAELHSTVNLSCTCSICPESTIAVQWYRSSDPDVYVKDGTALAWWYEGETGSSRGFGIKDDFSMIMYSVNSTNEGLYRCIVSPVHGHGSECSHDTKLVIYANPDTYPVIEYIRETNGFNVTCSISNAFPMSFPILTTKGGNGTTYINRVGTLNIDGTYNTTVTHWFPANDKDTTIECLYSNLNFKGTSSLRIVGSDSIDQPGEEDRMEKNMTANADNTDCRPRCKPSGLWMVWISLIIEVLFFIVVAYAIKSGRVHVLLNPPLCKTIRNKTDSIDGNGHHGENSKEEKPAKSTRNLFGKLSCAVITLSIPVTVLILLGAYLATA